MPYALLKTKGKNDMLSVDREAAKSEGFEEALAGNEVTGNIIEGPGDRERSINQ
ncbi:MAG: hypothetical protein L0213_02570 [Candidatus Dadabacteria bacterium]|nr:hypothetical protein [Candidatus Dadabacteria bacterium]